MKQSAFLIIATIFLTGCGEKNPPVDNINAPSVNSEIIDVRQVVGTGVVEPIRGYTNLAAASGGIVEEVLKNEGDIVKSGEAVIKLDDEIEQLKIKEISSQVKSQEEQIRLAGLGLADARIRLARKSGLLESTRKLLEKGAETSDNLDELETEVKSLILDTLKASSSLKLEETRLISIRENLALARVNAEKKLLRSPYDGIILNLDAKKGSSVSQFSTYAELAPSGPEIVKAEVDELFADRLRLDQDAEIRYIGSDSTIARGKVIFVSPYLTRKSLFSGRTGEQEDRLVRHVKISMAPDTYILLNSRVECVINIK
jgi:multidrug resistance efflux pump